MMFHVSQRIKHTLGILSVLNADYTIILGHCEPLTRKFGDYRVDCGFFIGTEDPMILDNLNQKSSWFKWISWVPSGLNEVNHTYISTSAYIMNNVAKILLANKRPNCGRSSNFTVVFIPTLFNNYLRYMVLMMIIPCIEITSSFSLQETCWVWWKRFST